MPDLTEKPDSPPQKNQAAAELGRRGGMKGGAARAASMTPEARAESARVAAQARWSRIRAEGQLSDDDIDQKPIVFTLTPDEAAHITETSIAGKGGLQSFQRRLQKQLLDGNTVTFDTASLWRLLKYIEKYGSGGFQWRLQQAFGRSIREMLGL